MQLEMQLTDPRGSYLSPEPLLESHLSLEIAGFIDLEPHEPERGMREISRKMKVCISCIYLEKYIFVLEYHRCEAFASKRA
jgi:hypothetical protein